MLFFESGSIKYCKFPSLENYGLYHAVFTRHGGFSPTPWQSLNFGGSVGDDRQRVYKNRETALKTLQIKSDSVYDVFQVHSTIIVKTDRPLALNEEHIKADAIITNKPNVTLMMRFADCVPILLFDPKIRAIGIAHAGWIGTVDKIARKIVLAMVENFGTNPNDLIAAIGPSIGPDHYSVGNDVINRLNTSFGSKAKQVILNKNNKSYLDLWTANQIILSDVGVNKIEVSNICTACNLNDWYSHRNEHGKTGRFGIIIGIT
jgi:hypothetical protein